MNELEFVEKKRLTEFEFVKEKSFIFLLQSMNQVFKFP